MAGTDETQLQLQRKVRLDPDETQALRHLFDAVAAVDGPPAIDVGAWTDLTQDGREGLVAVIAHQAGTDRPVGYAQLARDSSTAGNASPAPDASTAREGRAWHLELVVDPEVRVADRTVGEELARAAVAVVAEAGGGMVHLWLNQPRPVDERMAAAAGLTATRTLYQVRRPLPVDGELAGQALKHGESAIETRPFRSGEDETAWLEVNNRAFVWHPEQGGWDLVALARREAEPWFDPEGFLLLELEGRLAGFCWTKVHDDEDPVQGEIYVIAVDPDFEGQGLGRALTLAGLDHLADRGITVGMLYVDAANVGAVKLYADLGFVVDHVNRAYIGTVGP